MAPRTTVVAEATLALQGREPYDEATYVPFQHVVVPSLFDPYTPSRPTYDEPLVLRDPQRHLSLRQDEAISLSCYGGSAAVPTFWERLPEAAREIVRQAGFGEFVGVLVRGVCNDRPVVRALAERKVSRQVRKPAWEHLQQNPTQRLVRLQHQSVTTEDSPLSSLAALRVSSTSIFEEPATPTPSLAASTLENPNMAGTPPYQPLTVEDMLMNLQNSITTMQQRSAQTDANITRLNDLVNTRLPPPPDEGGEDDEDDQEQPIMIPDPNHEGRLIVQHNPRVIQGPAANPAGNVPTANPDIAALIAKMA
ncbi:hypothetical protein RHMOL_Rhmol10G0209100 [Rhododendron molle]|uniref:Uncharacterized protein n=1 Tax=Rhododendron molle TaxID=49168 RepID=A0ACC0M4S5_RHOML|nr:hypothetical protein RHMOL_Rhmol10G0209100 [Rhododendron molle]